jgi:hypothetical protein
MNELIDAMAQHAMDQIAYEVQSGVVAYYRKTGQVDLAQVAMIEANSLYIKTQESESLVERLKQ